MLQSTYQEGDDLGKIIVKGLKVFAYHGVNPEERTSGQVFICDIEAESDLKTACESDSLEDTANYAKIIKVTRETLNAGKCLLLERAAQKVAEGLLEEFPAIETVKIKLKKPDAPIKADFDYVGVEIEIKRSAGAE
jgi:7,8-dihydroneopterin aldolase/epimerase/oxygenase